MAFSTESWLMAAGKAHQGRRMIILWMVAGITSFLVVSAMVCRFVPSDAEIQAKYQAEVDPIAYLVPALAFSTALLLNTLTLAVERNSVKMQMCLIVCYINILAALTDFGAWMGWVPVLRDPWDQGVLITRMLVWLWTTPAMVYLLGLISDLSHAEVVVAVAADVAMLVAAYMALVQSNFWIGVLLIGISTGMFFYLMYQVWHMFQAPIDSAGRSSSAVSLKVVRGFTMVTWSGFVVVFMLAEFRLVSLHTEEWMWGGLAFLAKVMFSSSLMQSNFITMEDRRLNAMKLVEQGRRDQVIKELTTLVRQKHTIMSNISNELRTPLSCIVGLSDALLMGCCGELSEVSHRTIGSIRSSGMRVLKLVGDILDTAAIQEGQLVLRHEKVKIHRIVDDVIDLLQPMAQKRVRLLNDMSSLLPPVVGDPKRMMQIFHNLIGNACKYTKSGTINISAMLKIDEMEVAVADTGIGIPKEKLSEIFNAFSQVRPSGDGLERTGGAGLGLTLVKQLVEAHGGNITVRSKLHHGTTFYLTFKLWDPALDGSEEEAPRVMTPNDIEATKQRVTHMMRVLNLFKKTKVEEPPIEADSMGIRTTNLRRSRSFGQSLLNPFHRVAADALPALRAPSGTGNAPAVADTAAAVPPPLESYPQTPLTADAPRAALISGAARTPARQQPTTAQDASGPRARAPQRDASMELSAPIPSGLAPQGMVGGDIVTDPILLSQDIDPATVSSTEQNAMFVPACDDETRPLPAAPAEGLVGRARVAIGAVSDERDTDGSAEHVHVLSMVDGYMTMETWLMQKGFKVTKALDSQEALELIHEQRLPDIILSDTGSGFEVSRALNELHPTYSVPVIMVCAKDKEEGTAKGPLESAADVVAKPLGRKELLARIQAHLRYRANVTKVISESARSEEMAMSDLVEMLCSPSKAFSLPASIKSKVENNAGMSTTLQVFDDLTMIVIGVSNLDALMAGHTASLLEVLGTLASLYIYLDDLLLQYSAYLVDCMEDKIVIITGLGGDHLLMQACNALDLVLEIQKLAASLGSSGGATRLMLSAGIHSCTAMASVVGVRHPVLQVTGTLADRAMQLQSICPPGCIHVSKRVYDLCSRPGQFSVAVKMQTTGSDSTYLHHSGPWTVHLPTMPDRFDRYMSSHPFGPINSGALRLRPVQRALLSIIQVDVRQVMELLGRRHKAKAATQRSYALGLRRQNAAALTVTGHSRTGPDSIMSRADFSTSSCTDAAPDAVASEAMHQLVTRLQLDKDELLHEVEDKVAEAERLQVVVDNQQLDLYGLEAMQTQLSSLKAELAKSKAQVANLQDQLLTALRPELDEPIPEPTAAPYPARQVSSALRDGPMTMTSLSVLGYSSQAPGGLASSAYQMSHVGSTHAGSVPPCAPNTDDSASRPAIPSAAEFLHKLELPMLVPVFERERITPDMIPYISDATLLQLGVACVGDMVRLRRASQPLAHPA